MNVIFSRTGSRRYGVVVQRPPFPPVVMNPAPGYDPELPHDLVHFVVEDLLGLPLGVFGQLAAGGDAGTFRLASTSSTSRERARTQRRSRRRGNRLALAGEDQTALSERAASICHHAWRARSPSPERRLEARELTPHVEKMLAACSEVERGWLSTAMIGRVCDRLDTLSAQWSRLEVGGSIELHWSGGRRGAVRGTVRS